MSDKKVIISSTPSISDEIYKFRYQEIKDLSNQFLTLITGVLVVTVSFSDKILPLDQALSYEKCLLLICWISLLVAFILAGLGIHTNYNSGICRIKGTTKSLFFGNSDYETLHKKTIIILDFAGILFAIALICLAAMGGSRLFVQHDKISNTFIESICTGKPAR